MIFFISFAYFRWVNSQRLLVRYSKAPKNHSSISSVISPWSLFCNFCKAPANRTDKWPAEKLESDSIHGSTLPRVSKMKLLVRCCIYCSLFSLGINRVFTVNSQTEDWEWMMIFQVAWYLYLTKFMQTQPCAEELGKAALYLPFYFWCNRIGMRGREYIRVPHWESSL